MIKLSKEEEQFAKSIGATHIHRGKFIKSGDEVCAMVYSDGAWEYNTDLSDPGRYPTSWEDVEIVFSEEKEGEMKQEQSTQGEGYGNKTKQQDAILDALKELTAAYRRLGGLDCAYDKELLVAEAIIGKIEEDKK